MDGIDMEDIELLLAILIAGFSLLVFLVSIASFARIRTGKLLIVGVAFLMFFVKGLLLLLEFIVQDQIAFVIDLIIIVLLYIAVVKK